MSKRMFFLFLLLGLSAAPSVANDALPVVTVKQVGDGFVADMELDVPVAQHTAWEVLVDFDHMVDFASNLVSSRIAGREGNTLLVRQEGVARFGVLSFKFMTERELRLEPMSRILSKTLKGSVKHGSSEMRLMSSPGGKGVRLQYHSEFVPDSFFARFFGLSFIQHEIEEQFRLMALEMKRREAGAAVQIPAAVAG